VPDSRPVKSAAPVSLPYRRRLRAPLVAVVALTATPAAARAQVVTGRVVEIESRGALDGALVAAYGMDGRPSAPAVFSDRSGAFAIRLPARGLYRIRAEALGFEPAELDSLLVGEAGPVRIELALRQTPIALDTLEVRAPAQTLREEYSMAAVRRRHAETPRAGLARVFMQGDVEMKNAIAVDDVLRWVPPGGNCTVVYINGFRTDFPIGDMATDAFEAIEVYRRWDDLPMIYREAFPCGVVAAWSRETGTGRKLTLGRLLGLAGVVALSLFLSR